MIFRHHAPDRLLDDPLGIALPDFRGGEGLQAAGKTGEMLVNFLFFLVAGQLDLVGVDDEDKVAAVDVGGERRAVFTAQDKSDFGGQAAGRLVRCVNQMPLTLDLVLLDERCLHVVIPCKGRSTYRTKWFRSMNFCKKAILRRQPGHSQN